MGEQELNVTRISRINKTDSSSHLRSSLLYGTSGVCGLYRVYLVHGTPSEAAAGSLMDSDPGHQLLCRIVSNAASLLNIVMSTVDSGRSGLVQSIIQHIKSIAFSSGPDLIGGFLRQTPLTDPGQASFVVESSPADMSLDGARGILGVAPDADRATITKAYRRKALITHPDKPGGSDELFKPVRKAYDLLTKNS
jgi:hypothetical protein